MGGGRYRRHLRHCEPGPEASRPGPGASESAAAPRTAPPSSRAMTRSSDNKAAIASLFYSLRRRDRSRRDLKKGAAAPASPQAAHPSRAAARGPGAGGVSRAISLDWPGPRRDRGHCWRHAYSRIATHQAERRQPGPGPGLVLESEFTARIRSQAADRAISKRGRGKTNSALPKQTVIFPNRNMIQSIRQKRRTCSEQTAATFKFGRGEKK